MKATRLIALLGAACIFTGISQAQSLQTSGMREKLSASMKANQAALHTYTWKRRTEVMLKGETRSTKVDQCSYDTAGQVQTVPISSDTNAEKTPGGLRGRIAAKKKEEMGDYIKRMMTLVSQYFSSGSGRFQSAMESGNASFSKGTAEGTVRAAFKNLVTNGDTMTMVFDVAQHMPQSLSVATTLDSDPVNVSGKFTAIPGGPHYLSLMDVQSPAKQIEIKISNYDYRKTGSGD